MLRNLIGTTAERFGYHIVNWRANYPAEDCQLLDQVRPHTMVRPLRLLAICDAVAYVARNSITGDWVECGVCEGWLLTVGRVEDETSWRPATNLDV